MKAFKINLKGGIFVSEQDKDIPFSTILSEIIVEAPPQGESTADMCKAATVYGRLQQKKDADEWWADKDDFAFIKKRLDARAWGRPRSVDPIKTKLQISAFVQSILDLKEEDVPGT